MANNFSNPFVFANLPKGWSYTPIEELCERVTSGGTPLRSCAEYYEGGTIPWYKTQELKDNILFDSLEHITPNGLRDSSAKVFPVNTVLLALYGDGRTITSLGILGREGATNQACCAMIADPTVCNHRYLFYALKLCRPALIHVASGGAQRNLSGQIVRRFAIPTPPLAIQIRIAEILGKLDDKIDLNRRTNETLEAIARALFKSWFIDFDPVHAKAAGKKPDGLDAATAALFPSGFEETESGSVIPMNWGIQPLYGTATFINGAAFRNEHFCCKTDGDPVIKIAELKNGITSQTRFSHRSDLDSRYRIDTGDLLYSWSGSPDTSLDTFLWTKGPGFLNQHIFKVVCETAAHQRFAYYLLKALRPTLIEIARDKQTTGLGHVTVADMQRLHVCHPPGQVLAAFDRIVEPLFTKAITLKLESENLVAARDALLPKLLSGELRVGGFNP